MSGPRQYHYIPLPALAAPTAKTPLLFASTSKNPVTETKDFNDLVYLTHNEQKPLLSDFKRKTSTSPQPSLQQNLTLNAFSLLLEFLDYKEIVFLLPSLCKALSEKSEFKKGSERYRFKCLQLKAKQIIPASIKLNLSTLQTLEMFLNNNSLLKELFEFSPLLQKEKKKKISKNKIRSFKRNYFGLQDKLPNVLGMLKQKYMEEEHPCAPTMCFTGLASLPFAIGALICCGVQAPFYVTGCMVRCPMGTGGLEFAAGKYSLNKLVIKVQNVVIEIGELSGFNFLENFIHDTLNKQHTANVIHELKQITKSRLVSQQIRFFSHSTNEEVKSEKSSLRLTSS